MSDRWTVVVNPSAGRGQAAPDVLEHHFHSLGAEVHVVAPEGVDNLRAAVAEAAGEDRCGAAFWVTRLEFAFFEREFGVGAGSE